MPVSRDGGRGYGEDGVGAGEGFVEHDEARGMGRCALIKGGGGSGETRQGQREGFFAA